MRLPDWHVPSRAVAWLNTTPPTVRNGLFRGLCLIAPLLLFLAFFNPYVLDPTRVGWALTADWGQHFLGWNAFRNTPWSSFNHEDLLYNPAGLAVIYTDSNPLFAFIFKPFRAILPEHFQYIGIWFLFCVCMHFFFSWKLVRPHAPNRWAALGGAIALSALPCLYYRMRHDTLMAQWLILWALHLVINVPDGPAVTSLPEGTPRYRQILARILALFDAKTFGWMALLGVTGLIHPYILFMLAAIWGGDVLRRFWPAARTFNRTEILGIVVRSIATLAMPVITLGISGAYSAGQSPGAGGWAYYSSSFDLFFNPVVPEFSTFLRAWPLSPGQAFEGYQYLGFGLLVLIVAAVVLYIMAPEAKAARPFLGKLKPLILPFVVLALVAMTNRVQIYGHTILYFDLPPALKGIAAILRASGRFLWPIGYCAVFAALVVLFKARPRIVGVLLPLVLVLQAVDLNGFAWSMRDATALASKSQTFYLTPSPLWDKLIARSKGVDFYPVNVHFNDKLFYELTLRATTAAKPVNTMYPARENLIQIAHEEADQLAFKHGVVRNDRLFVFLKQCDAPAELQSRLRMLDGVWIIPPDAAKDIDLPAPEWTPLDTRVRFGWLDQGTCLLDENWARPEYDGTWTAGPKAEVLIPIKHVQFDRPNPSDMDLSLKAKSITPVVVSVLINGRKMSEITLSHRLSEHAIPLPDAALRADNLNVSFEVENPDPETVEVSQSEIKAPLLAGTATAAGTRAGTHIGTPHITGRGAAAAAVAVKSTVKDRALAIKLLDMTIVEREATQNAAAAKAKTKRPGFAG